jgi:hypothetical protein
MSQVMQYGFPHREWLLCENPVCSEKATFMATETGPNAKLQIFGCTEHISQLTIARPNHVSMRLLKLKTPGERNVSTAAEKS